MADSPGDVLRAYSMRTLGEAIFTPATGTCVEVSHSISILDTAAFVAYSSGLMQGQIAIVSVLASLYGAVTALLAWIFIRDRLQWSQWLGIGVVFVGIALVNI